MKPIPICRYGSTLVASLLLLSAFGCTPPPNAPSSNTPSDTITSSRAPVGDDDVEADAALKKAYSAASFQQSFEHRYADVNGVKLHYVIGGKGEPVVLLHGYPATWFDYRYVMMALAPTHTVVAVDLRGLGDSSKPDKGYDAYTVAGDVTALAQQLGFARYSVVGHDVGAPVAYAVAVADGPKIHALVELELVLAGAGLEELVEAAGPHLWFFQFQEVPDLPERLVKGKERIYLQPFFNEFTHTGDAIGEESMAEYVRTYSLPGSFHAGFEYYRELPTTAAKTKHAMETKLTMPVLAMTGENSMGAPGLGQPAEKSIRRLATNVTYRVIPKSGHWIAEERPAYLASQIDSFIAAAK